MMEPGERCCMGKPWHLHVLSIPNGQLLGGGLYIFSTRESRKCRENPGMMGAKDADAMGMVRLSHEVGAWIGGKE